MHMSNKHRQTDRQTNKQTDRQTDRQTNRQTDRQTNRQTGKRRGISLFLPLSLFPFHARPGLTRPWRSLLLKNLDGGVQGSPAKPDLHGEITNSPCKLVYMVEKAAKITI